MRILGIDTAIPIASAALVEGGDLLAEATQDRLGLTGSHAEVILPLIQTVFDRVQVPVDGLCGIAVSIGPGSFTGLRIGLATAKGMAFESKLPLVGISTLHAAAARLRNFDGLIASVLDARKNEIYAALFRRRQNELSRLTADAVLPVASAIELLREHQEDGEPLVLIGSGAQAYESEFTASLGASARIISDAGYSSVAAQAALLAQARFAAGEVDDSGTLAPVYLRASEAEHNRKN